MSINDKIKQILIDKNLSPSYFADEIGVQRSSISHILSGRNRPSFDIIQKIIRRFPDLGYEWIMEEEPSASTFATAYSSNLRNTSVGRQSTDRSGPPSQPAVPSPGSLSSPSAFRIQRNEIPPADPSVPVGAENASVTTPPVAGNSEKKVERILIFYTDGSFRDYTPST